MMYFCHHPIKQHFHDLLGFQRLDKNGRPRDVIAASNTYSYRRRIEREGKLVLPYMSYKLLNTEIDDEAYTRKPVLKGVNVAGINKRVWCEPTTFLYEGLFVCNKSTTLYEVYERLRADAANDTTIDVPVRLSDTDAFQDVPVYLDYQDIEKDPVSTEVEYIEKNELKMLELTFGVKGLMFHNHTTIQSIQTILPEFYTSIVDDFTSIDKERFELATVATDHIDSIQKYPNET